MEVILLKGMPSIHKNSIPKQQSTVNNIFIYVAYVKASRQHLL